MTEVGDKVKAAKAFVPEIRSFIPIEAGGNQSYEFPGCNTTILLLPALMNCFVIACFL